MVLPTRQQLIQQKKWRTVVVETEVGALTVAEPTADAPVRMADLHRRQAAGERVELEMTLEMICSGLVEPDGAPMFATRDAAQALLACISSQSLQSLLTAYTGLLGRAGPAAEGAGGNSSGSPSSG